MTIIIGQLLGHFCITTFEGKALTSTFTEEGIFTSLRAVHPINASFLMVIDDDGIETLFKFVQFLNVLLLIVRIEGGIEISSKEAHPSKAAVPIDETD